MAGRDRNLNIGITSSFDGRGVKSAEASAKVIERELNRVEQQQRRQVQMQMQAAQEMQAAERQREQALRSRVQTQMRAEREMAAEQAKNEQDLRSQYQMQSQAEREMAAEMEQRAAVIERINEQQRAAMETSGRLILGVSVAAAAGLALTAKAAMDWESAWAGVTKTVDGNAEELAHLEGQLRSLARSLPATHGEIAAVAEAAGQLGVQRESIAGFTKVMIDLGETTNLTADEAATALAQLMNIMGTSQGDVGRLGATIVALGNAGASTERDIVTMAQRIAGAGKLVGASEGEVLALASALSSMGVTAELGGGVASRVLQDLYKAVTDGAEATEGFAEVAGVSAADFARAFREDPVRALALFADGLNRVEANGGNVITTLTDLGFKSSEEQRILLQLKANTDLLTDSLDLQAEAWSENTALLDEANKRYQTTEARLQIARNQINDAAIDIGGNFLPVVATATEAVGAMAAGFGSLPGPVQQWVTGIGAAATGVGLFGGAMLIAVPKMHEFKQTLDALHRGNSRLGKAVGGAASILTGPWGLAVAGATIAVGVWAKAQGEARLKTEDLAATLDAQTGALTENSTAWIQSELTKDQSFGIRNTQSMAEAAREMGISIETLTRAYEGHPAAIREAKAAAEEWADQNADLSLASHSQADRFIRNLDDQNRRLEDAREIQAAKKDIDAAATNQQAALADQYGATNPLIDEQTGLFEENGAAVQDAQEALDALKEALDGLNGPMLSLNEANRQWEESLAALREGMKDEERTLDITTEAGRKHQAMLDGLAKSGMERATALLDETGSQVQFRSSLEQSRQALYDMARSYGITEEEAWRYVDSVLAIPAAAYTEVDLETGNAKASLEGMLVEINGSDGTITINGDPANADQTLGELIGNVDESDGTVTINGEKVPAELTLGQLMSVINGSAGVADILGDDAEGRRKLGTFLSAIGVSSASVGVNARDAGVADFIARYNGKTVAQAYMDVYTRLVDQGVARGQAASGARYTAQALAQANRQAHGSVLEFYGRGGLREQHVAQIAPAGAWRVWAEPETGGEAYIPLAASKRDRSEAILGDVARRFGMYVGRYADGAVVGGGGAGIAAMPAAWAGPATFNLYDADGVLLGTMRGEAVRAVAETSHTRSVMGVPR